MTFKSQFDRIIINDDLNRACQEAEEIVKGFLDKRIPVEKIDENSTPPNYYPPTP
jgi:hypothetical protein